MHRRNLVLTEMELDRVISHAQADQARNAPLGLRIAQPETSVAPWFQEEVRRELEKRFGSEQVHEAGLKVETTLDLDLQKTANRAIADGLAAYERRRGWVGYNPSGKLENVLASGSTIEDYKHPDWATSSGPGSYVHAVVTRALPMEIHARVGDAQIVLLPEDWRWTGKRYGDALLKPGDIIYVHLADAIVNKAQRATLEQDSGAQGALMAIDNTSGDVLAMVGGRDYALSQYNRATQAERQTGSSFKPYVYTAAVENGAKPTDFIVDAPVSFGGYTPHNYEKNYMGKMTLTDAFAESRNIPVIKLADQVGIQKVIDVAHRFGVTANIPAYLPVALGAVGISLQEQVTSYAVFPNDGLRVKPRLIKKVSNADGITLWEESPAVNEVISQQTARTMMVLFQAVIQHEHGTGAAAAQLNHPLGGKTGTTSEYTDAWFLGFSPTITCGVWVGFDTNQSLGEKETGARAALPIWMTWMRAAISGKDDEQFLSSETGSPTLKAAARPPVIIEVAGSPARPLRVKASTKPQQPIQSKPTFAAVRPAFTTPTATSPARPNTTQPSIGPAANPTSKSSTKRSAQPANGTPATRSATGSRIRPALIPETAPARPTGAVKPVIAHSASPSKPDDSSSSAKSYVKVALTPSPAPALPKVSVKPALNSGPNPTKPKDQR